VVRAILIGDSIRMGYQSCVARTLGDRADVWAPDQNGGDSDNVLSHLDAWVFDRHADLVHLNCGLHDLRLQDGNHQVPLEQYRQNLLEIIDRFSAEPGPELIWATTTPVIDERHQRVKSFERHESDVRRYNETARDLMTNHGVAINDLHELVMQAGCAHLLADDGVHFTEEGYHLLGQAVAERIEAAATPEGERSD
jgi:lysophospholipase L1-like esterase